MAIEITSQSLAGTPSEEPAVYKESPARALSGFPATDKSVSRSRFWHPTSRWTRRNFSSRASALSGGEVIILSVPKSGRTWIRAFLCAYFCKRHGLAKECQRDAARQKIRRERHRKHDERLD